MRSNSTSSSNAFFKKIVQSKFVDGLTHLIYPNNCLVCDTELSRSETVICATCYSELHYTHFELASEPTSLDKLFWGKVQIDSTFALLYYEKTNTSKNLLASLKYKKRSDVGERFGRMIGNKLQGKSKFRDIDALIPVPIHPKKEFIRGYNQSKVLANGISLELGIPVASHFIRRATNSKSQTKLGRFNRWDNVSGKFQLASHCNFKHIALVDDVVTTGATLESIIEIIRQKYPTLRISVISLAVTK